MVELALDSSERDGFYYALDAAAEELHEGISRQRDAVPMPFDVNVYGVTRWLLVKRLDANFETGRVTARCSITWSDNPGDACQDLLCMVSCALSPEGEDPSSLRAAEHIKVTLFKGTTYEEMAADSRRLDQFLVTADVA